MPTSAEAERAALDRKIELSRHRKPALFAFVSELRAGREPSITQAALMLMEADVPAEEARPILQLFAEHERSASHDPFDTFMATLQSFNLPES